MQKSYRRWKLKNKVLVEVFLLTGITVLFFTYVAVSVFQKRMDARNEAFYARSVSGVASRLSDYFAELGAVANTVNYDYDLQNYLHESSKSSDGIYNDTSSSANMRDYELAMQTFSSTINDRSDITSIMVFNQKRMLLYRSIYSYYSVIMNYADCNWYQEALQRPGQPVITGPQQHEFLTGNSGNTLSMSRTIYDSTDGSPLGVILLDFNTNRLQEYLDEVSTQDGGRICLLNTDGSFICEEAATKENPVTLQDADTDAMLVKALSGKESGSALCAIYGEKYQVVFQTMEETGWKILAISPYRLYQKTTMENTRDMLLLFGLVMVVILLSLNQLLTRIISPIQNLKATVDVADAGNLHVRAQVESQDEIGQLAVSYNAMMDRIVNLKEQVVQEQEEKRKMELQALQAQINPHFLYNTLDAIIWMAETDDKGIVPMTEALANFFRISLNKGKEFIRVQGEMSHVENYLVIQSMRYEDKFTYEILVEEEVKNLLTIKLIIQPIVENCIYHGIKPKRGKGHIFVHAFCQENYLLIKVKDDGVGMTEEKCSGILSSQAVVTNNSGSGVGIRNVNERIRLRFGNTYGLSFESRLGEGTTVTVKLPVILQDEVAKERWQ